VQIFEILNRIVTSVFDSKRAQLFEIDKGVQENDVSVKICMCIVLLLTMVQVLYLLGVFILAHYGPPSTETPTTETTTVRCQKNHKKLNLFNKYLLLVTFGTTITI